MRGGEISEDIGRLGGGQGHLGVVEGILMIDCWGGRIWRQDKATKRWLRDGLVKRIMSGGWRTHA